MHELETVHVWVRLPKNQGTFT